MLAEIKVIDRDIAAVVHVVGLLDPTQTAPLSAMRTQKGRLKDRPRKEEAQALFVPGEINKGMLGVLREATAPMNVGDVARAMLTAKKVDPETVYLGSLSRRLSTNLQKLADRGRLRKHADPDGMRWEIDR